MLTQVVQFKNLTPEHRAMFKNEIDPERIVYVVKDRKGIVKSILTSVTAAIQKAQAKI
jgi:hypothetical protein